MTVPDFLINNFKEWKTNTFDKNKDYFKKISKLDQKPKAMIISCCDSRVQPTSIFKADIGELFIHKNIANLVPSNESHYNESTTLAAVEYAIISLKIPNIIILGHSNCGGIKYGYSKLSENKFDKNFKFLNKWVDILKPVYKNISNEKDNNDKLALMEKKSIENSIINLTNFPIVKKEIKENKLNIYGFWYDISKGELFNYNHVTKLFENGS